jgi:hypothetical protein
VRGRQNSHAVSNPHITLDGNPIPPNVNYQISVLVQPGKRALLRTCVTHTLELQIFCPTYIFIYSSFNDDANISACMTPSSKEDADVDIMAQYEVLT